MRKTYCVRLPLEFPSGYRIGGLDQPVKTDVLGHPAELSAEDGNCVLTVKAIESEDAARDVLNKLCAGICWAALELKTGISASPKAQKVTYSDDSDEAGKKLMLNRPVDVVIDAGSPAIFAEDARIAKVSAGSVTALKSTTPERFFAALREGLEQASPEALAAGDEAWERTESAIDLYVLSHFEPNTVPRFLLQCAALEVLAPPGHSEPAHIVTQVEAWMTEARDLARKQGGTKCEQGDFNRLAERVGQLKSISHGERIRRFARQAFSRVGVGDVEDKVKRLMSAYRARGGFLHEGDRSKIGSAATEMNDLLPLLLKAVLTGA